MGSIKLILKSIQRLRYRILGGSLLLIASALLLSWISSGWMDISSWGSFLFVLILSVLVLLIGWLLIKDTRPPGWLGYLLLGAVILRLVLGVVWFLALPAGGYASPAERKGYVMADAYNRDRAAWKIASRHYSVWKIPTAVRSLRKFDQYGGMLLLSSLIYQVSGVNLHEPLLIVVITASFSALAVLFAWAFGSQVWGASTAKLAAWGLVLYPEAVLLGSSQMREAFLITLIMAVFYTTLIYINKHTWKSLVGVLIALLLCLPFSPPATAIVLVMLVIFGAIVGDVFLLKQRKIWLILIIIIGLILLGIWFAWSRYAPLGISNPVSLIAWWFKITAGMQARLSRLDSGWIQKILKSVPIWLRYPLLISYGMVRPFLPAALIDISSTPIWRGISIWRAVGWTLLLPFLVYAPVMCFRRPQPGREAGLLVGRALTLVVWLGVVAASLRAGADLWDNPRYRAMFAGVQVLLAAWVWVSYRQQKDIWLKHTLVGIGFILAWFIPWYLRRYTPISWPVDDFFKTLALGIATTILYLIWEWSSSPAGNKFNS
jgi:hypothetical protein